MKTQSYAYSVISEGDGVISLKSDQPCSFQFQRIDGDVEAEREGTDESETAYQMTFRLTGSGRLAFYAACRGFSSSV